MRLPFSNALLLILKLVTFFSKVLPSITRLIVAHIPLFLYPFLNTTSKSRPFEYLRLTSLGVIGALVKSDSPPTIEFLLTTEIIPLCLRIMETGSELSKVLSRVIYSNACRLLRYLFCKRFSWTIRVYNISVVPMIVSLLWHKCLVSWSMFSWKCRLFVYLNMLCAVICDLAIIQSPSPTPLLFLAFFFYLPSYCLDVC